jgi:DNA-binding NarL/FixJ family response regulator
VGAHARDGAIGTCPDASANQTEPCLCRARRAPLLPGNTLLQSALETHQLPHESLSDREYQVFCLIGSGLSVKEVADRLSLSVKTVSTYRCRALQSTGLKNNAQIIHYVVRHQLSVAEPELVH